MNELRDRFEVLKQRVAALSEDLQSLESLLKVDVPSSLNKIRFITEKVLREICLSKGVTWGEGEPTLERMIGPLISTGAIPKNIAVHVRTIQTNTSPGSHYQESALSSSHVTIAQLALLEFLNWHYASTSDTVGTQTQPADSIKAAQAPDETDAERFAKLFGERPDVIAEVEAEASQASSQMVEDFEKQLVRLEVCVCNPPPPHWDEPKDTARRNRLLALIERNDGALEEASAFVAVSRRCDARFREWFKQATNEQRRSMYSIPEQEHQSGYSEWREALDSYLQVIGGRAVIRRAVVALGRSVFPLVCVSFRRFGSEDAADGWIMELELAKVMSQLKDFRALPFIADAALTQEDKMNSHNDIGVGIARAVQAFGVDRKTVDECFERLLGISASEILRARRDDGQC